VSCRAAARERRLGAQRDRRAHVLRAHAPALAKVGDRPRDSQRAMLAARAEQSALASVPQHLLALLIEPHESPQHPRVHVRVHRRPAIPKASGLALARKANPLAGASRARQRRGVEVVRAVALEVREQVDAIEQRPAEPAAVAGEVGFTASTPIDIPRVAARTRVGRRDQHEPSRIQRGVVRPHDCHAPILERLAQCLQGRPRELRELVQEQHPVMRQHHLADTSPLRAADEARRGGR